LWEKESKEHFALDNFAFIDRKEENLPFFFMPQAFFNILLFLNDEGNGNQTLRRQTRGPLLQVGMTHDVIKPNHKSNKIRTLNCQHPRPHIPTGFLFFLLIS